MCVFVRERQTDRQTETEVCKQDHGGQATRHPLPLIYMYYYYVAAKPREREREIERVD